jgi:hypothetical protein
MWNSQRGETTDANHSRHYTDAEGRYEIDGLPPGAYQVRALAFDVEAYAFSLRRQPLIIPKDKPDPVRMDLELEAKEFFLRPSCLR